ncbi:hypothetical protein [Marivita hallyeonensis]|uniref:Lipoprotein n=1 Tax=Marivita hallyeonensis TaxID=996342 RepID=A0A1M5X875_9RHOB|nr:hypothetical protein [Marivita hallyeonensis]SHH95694.1 hypothetical protein SAMN05443551_3804 [Marivita hallyeonensis]
MRRLLLTFPLLFLLVACGDATRDLQSPTDPIGDFQIGHIGVVAPNLQKLLVSRDATADEWITAVTDALAERFERYDGGKFYHLGVSVEAYSLPPPVIPGKSAIALNVTVWDDAAQAKMNEQPKQIQIIRLVETRLASTKETQMQWLAAQAAKDIETWMREMQDSDGWFVGPPAAAPAELVDNATSSADEVTPRLPVSVPDDVVAITNAAAATPSGSQ